MTMQPPGIDPGQQPPPQQQQPVIVNVPPAPPAQPIGDFISRADAERLINEERERVRKEEKDKLYPQLETLGQTVKQLEDERNTRLAAEEEAARQAAETERLRQEEAMTALERLEQYKSEQDLRFEQLQREADTERALRAKETEFAQLSSYRYQRLQEEADNIAPQLADLVTGNTQEQINQSIETMKAKTAEILNEVAQANLTQQRTLAPPISGAPPVDMSAMAGGDQQRTLTPDDIRDMDMNEYAQFRSQLLGAASERVKTGGIYAP